MGRWRDECTDTQTDKQTDERMDRETDKIPCIAVYFK